MNKAGVARLITATGIAAGLLGLAIRSRTLTLNVPGFSIKRTGRMDVTPQDTIYRMLDAARAGDAETYIACYTGPMEQRLRKTREEMTPARFADYLAVSNKAIKGIAMPQPARVAEGEATLLVEWVYENHNETQRMWCARLGDEWKITRVEESERAKTLIPYGTPVQ